MKTIFGLLSLALTAPLYAGTPAVTTSATPATNSVVQVKIPTADHAPVRVTNTVSIAGEAVTYAAETGMLPLLKPDGSSRASVFYVAYTRLETTNTARRPVTFCFNGGPGSASVWLHLGALGPRRVKMNPDGSLPPPPFALADNEFSLLNASDLVFIDPVATGFSRVEKEEKAEQFLGEAGDLDSVGEFIRLWTTRHERWLSPKYLCGESYGVFRAAGLAEYLRGRYGLYLNGLIMVSGVLDFGTLISDGGNDLPYELALPAYTAAAFYHHKLPADLQGNLDQALQESRAFANGPYPSALQQGAALAPEARKTIVATLVRLTGLTARVIEDNNLRVDSGVFRKALLHDEGLILGAYDARLTGRDGDAAATEPGFDPSATAVMGPFSAAMNSYVRSELKFEDDLPYEILTPMPAWDYRNRNRLPSASAALAEAVNQNPYLKVLVLGGRCDLVCPVDCVRYSIRHSPLAEAYQKNVTYSEFEAGHMLYINQPDLRKLQTDVEKFLQP